jgi:hypothetical protein
MNLIRECFTYQEVLNLTKAALVATKPLGNYWRGSFTDTDNHHYFPHTFKLPAAAAGIRATLSYTGKRNFLGLCLYDAGRLRAYGRTEERNGVLVLTAEVQAEETIPAAIAGPLSDIWQAEITTNQVEELCHYELVVEVWLGGSTKSIIRRVPPRLEKIHAIPGWYRGDLHVHSTDSDGTKCVSELFNIAGEQGLNFLAVTDHNSICNWWKLPGKTQGILPLPSMEITTFLGHANAFGIDDWVDWRTGKDGRTINDVADEVHEKGGLFSVNHPCTPGLPNGHASWRHDDFDWRKADALEVWNAPVFSGGEAANQQCRQLWDHLLNQGLRITGLGGSDAHYLGDTVQPVGLPVNYLYLDELSREGILQAIKKGRVFVTRGPEIYFYAISSSGHTLPGGEIAHGKDIRLSAQVNGQGVANLKLRIIKNGNCVRRIPVKQDYSCFNLDVNCKAGDWYRLELEEEGGSGKLAAFTNPVYIG